MRRMNERELKEGCRADFRSNYRRYSEQYGGLTIVYLAASEMLTAISTVFQSILARDSAPRKRPDSNFPPFRYWQRDSTPEIHNETNFGAHFKRFNNDSHKLGSDASKSHGYSSR